MAIVVENLIQESLNAQLSQSTLVTASTTVILEDEEVALSSQVQSVSAIITGVGTVLNTSFNSAASLVPPIETVITTNNLYRKNELPNPYNVPLPLSFSASLGELEVVRYQASLEEQSSFFRKSVFYSTIKNLTNNYTSYSRVRSGVVIGNS